MISVFLTSFCLFGKNSVKLKFAMTFFPRDSAMVHLKSIATSLGKLQWSFAISKKSLGNFSIANLSIWRKNWICTINFFPIVYLVNHIEILLAEGADATLKTRKGLSPFHLAVRKTNIPFIKLLYFFHPNFDVKDFEENNAIEFVLKEEHQDAMRIILCHLHKQ